MSAILVHEHIDYMETRITSQMSQVLSVLYANYNSRLPAVFLREFGEMLIFSCSYIFLASKLITCLALNVIAKI